MFADELDELELQQLEYDRLEIGLYMSVNENSDETEYDDHIEVSEND